MVDPPFELPYLIHSLEVNVCMAPVAPYITARIRIAGNSVCGYGTQYHITINVIKMNILPLLESEVQVMFTYLLPSFPHMSALWFYGNLSLVGSLAARYSPLIIEAWVV